MNEILLVLVIFLLRVLNNSMGTLRVIVMTNGRRALSFFLAFMEALVFAFTASQVLTDLNNIPNLMAYAGGFAVGNYVGILIEEKFITGYVTVNIITTVRGHEVAVLLREAGYGVTETVGDGAMGNVSVLRSVVVRTQVRDVIEKTHALVPDAFITTEEAKSVHSGWLRDVRRAMR